MSRCSAWKLEFGAGERAVIGPRELLHLLDAPRMHAVPHTPAHCRHLLFWEQGVLPVLDLGAWSRGERSGETATLIGLVGFAGSADGAPDFGALVLSSVPTRIDVDDGWACALPETLNRWRRVACACIELDGEILPVLDLSRCFAPGLPPSAEA